MSKKQAAKIETITRKLYSGFVWDATSQGAGYWSNVVRELSMLRDAELEPKERSKK